MNISIAFLFIPDIGDGRTPQTGAELPLSSDQLWEDSFLC